MKDLQLELDALKYLLSKPSHSIHKQYYAMQTDFHDQLDEAWGQVIKLEKEIERYQNKIKEMENFRLLQEAKLEQVRLMWERVVAFGVVSGWNYPE